MHSLSDKFNRWSQQLAEQPHLSELYYRGIQDFESLEGAELVRFTIIMSQLFRNYEDAYYGQLEGHLDARVWHSWKRPCATSTHILEFRLGGVHARIGTVRWGLRITSISYSRQLGLQDCIVNQMHINDPTNR